MYSSTQVVMSWCSIPEFQSAHLVDNGQISFLIYQLGDNGLSGENWWLVAPHCDVKVPILIKEKAIKAYEKKRPSQSRRIQYQVEQKYVDQYRR